MRWKIETSRVAKWAALDLIWIQLVELALALL